MNEIAGATDILVVGAGPVGLALATRLVSTGLTVTIIDAQAEGANTSRAAVIHARTLEVLEEIDVTTALVARGIKVPVFKVRDRGKVLLSVDFSDLPTPYPFSLMCPQNETEEVLLDRFEALGGKVVRPATLIRATSTWGGVSAEFILQGQSHEITAKYIVGCDGMHSKVRSEAGIGFDGSSYEQDFVLGDVKMTWPFARDEIDLFFSADGLVVVAPLPNDRYRIVATADNAPEKLDRAYLQALLNERGPVEGSGEVLEVVWSSRFHLHHRVADAPLKGRFVLCGDAAHVHSPAGGQGMNTGIQDAITLAEPLAKAIQTEDRTSLTDWAASRHDIALDVVALTDRVTRAATIKSEFGRTLRNAALSFVGHLPLARRAIANNLAELNNR